MNMAEIFASSQSVSMIVPPHFLIRLRHTLEGPRMVAFVWVVGLICAIVELVLGVLLNIYIIGVNVADRRRGRPLSLCDKILVLMAANNICLQSDMNICTFLFVIFPEMLQYHNVYSLISVFLIFQFYFSFWITATLCVYYCLRIVNFKLSFFIYLKTNITDVVTRFLVGSAVGSFAISLASIWEINLKLVAVTGNVTAGSFIVGTNINLSAVTGNVTSSPWIADTNINLSAVTGNVTSSPWIADTNINLSAVTGNVTSSPWIVDTNVDLAAITGNITSSPQMIDATIQLSKTYKFLTITFGCCLPFALAVLSIILTLTSLLVHYHDMKYNPSGFSVPRLDAHMRAARIMVYLIVLYSIFYLSEVSLLASSLTIQSTSDLAALFFVLIYPTAQSTIVIVGNSKLCPMFLKSGWSGKKVKLPIDVGT
ncbi:taste receptor type 2 member 123-like [Rana temporaria]|uniref:taste receptor type 2 member 123-like n=1 Tax=Rana temporaria TaxID=8407 RepID=UPI001AACB67E|nr:taste receptor type 2 member 123-like [Rana temporaria]